VEGPPAALADFAMAVAAAVARATNTRAAYCGGHRHSKQPVKIETQISTRLGNVWIQGGFQQGRAAFLPAAAKGVAVAAMGVVVVAHGEGLLAAAVAMVGVAAGRLAVVAGLVASRPRGKQCVEQREQQVVAVD
jgi:hypothetical protein